MFLEPWEALTLDFVLKLPKLAQSMCRDLGQKVLVAY